MASYPLTNGHTIETSYPMTPGAIAFETKGPEGDVISTVTKYGAEATNILLDLMVAAAMRRMLA
ncbi:hypothetical protein ACIP6P_00585 [Streptomyces sp. NPDC088729]|uniref:hypothetical protein n=1 Tax=Streptomyces sp. NPDC088729 TaxID=3365876 RepID=UPI0038143EE9